MKISNLFFNPEKFFRSFRGAYKFVLGLWLISVLLGLVSNYMVRGFYSYKLVFISFAFVLPLLFLIKFLFISVFMKAFGSKSSLVKVVDKFFFLGYFYLVIFGLLSILDDFINVRILVFVVFLCILVHSVYSLKGIYKVDGYKIVASYIILSTFFALFFLVIYVLSMVK